MAVYFDFASTSAKNDADLFIPGTELRLHLRSMETSLPTIPVHELVNECVTLYI